VKECQIF